VRPRASARGFFMRPFFRVSCRIPVGSFVVMAREGDFRLPPAIGETTVTTSAALAKPAHSAISNAQTRQAEPTATTATATPPTTVKKSGTVLTNGVRTYYEIHGGGEPLLILHGGLGSVDMFRPILPALAAGRQVVAIDLLGHGRTELGNRRIDLAE